MKAVIYARVSSDRQEEAGTIESQLDAIMHNPAIAGKQIGEVYADDGVSGYTKALWDRPAGARLLADARNGSLHGCELLIYRLNRIGRRGREIEQALDYLLDCGVTVYSIKEGYRFDNQTAMGRFTRQLLASLAELDRNTIVETTRDGMVRKARQGKLLPTMARLGYDWSETTEDGRKKPGAQLLVNQTEAELVRLIFERFPSMTLNGLVKWLNINGYRLPCKRPVSRTKHQRTERLFNPKAITDIITDELYLGMVTWGKTTRVSGHKPENFRHHVPELQIVAFEAFNHANAALKERRRVPSKSQNSPYLFSGLLRCPECGGKTVGHRHRSHSSYPGMIRIYTCRRYHTEGKTACKGWATNESTVIKAVIPFLADLLENKLRVREHLGEAARHMQWERRGDRTQRIEAEVAVARHALAKLQEGYLAGIFDAEEARTKALEYRETIERGERRLNELETVQDLTEDLGKALRLLEMPLEDFLWAMVEKEKGQEEGRVERRFAGLCRAVFERFAIRAWGRGWERQAEVVSYELTPPIKQASADAAHIESTWPALETV